MKMTVVCGCCLWLLIGCATPTQHRIILSESSPPATPQADSAGPTVYLIDDSGEPPVNPISSLMYFVQLISPEPVEMSKSDGNTQMSRILSIKRHENSGKFSVICQFEIFGAGTQQNIFDQTVTIRANEDFLVKGGTLKHRLGYINIEGTGRGSLRVEGTLTGGRPLATQFSFRFNGQGQRSPVTIGLNDIRWIDGSPHAVNEQVIRVNSLSFRRPEGPPKMEITVASIKSRNAGNGLLINLVGKFKGTVANLFIPPVSIKADGNDALMDFAQAIVEGQPQFTFPTAR